jgi:acyl-CoA reductase-like NAD-dependent aldehyde dehydrogenase
LTRIADRIDQDHERLARIESEDTGKPLSQARSDALIAARYFRFYGHAIDSYYGQTIPLSTDLHVYTRREPFGVTGHIIAWNYPMQLLARAVAWQSRWETARWSNPPTKHRAPRWNSHGWRCKPVCRLGCSTW